MQYLSHSLVGLFLAIPFFALAQPQPDNEYLQVEADGTLVLTQEGASFFARMALECMQREYPNKLNQMLPDSSMLQEPRVLHPAFYGCFDWHSAVHGHWMLVRLLRQFPELPEATEIRRKLDENLTAENIAGEVSYLAQASKSWERMYGWAWLLKLAEELHTWPDAQAKSWAQNLEPLTRAIRQRYLDFLPVQQIPVRTGVHPNTAFGMSFAWDYAQTTNDQELMRVLSEAAARYYSQDSNCPAAWEPSGEDFLSPCLEEAALMARLLSPEAFRTWFSDFLPADALTSLSEPAGVADRSDPKIVHLDGLNLSRVWNLYVIIPRLEDEMLRNQLIETAARHLHDTLPHIATEHYEGSHWLASFAVYALSVNAR